ncbi:SIMPL domain-containing protein [Prescottella sp. R16]|uniref:SIMPL domain-containing protein n=1 Tax=Prescottella sp. R16 TaxID=3064529 RepID=UPI00272EDEF3|nr:SIMPL domain-containing protein [Prescottella sp. R16]
MRRTRTKLALATVGATAAVLTASGCSATASDPSNGQPAGINSQGTGKVTGTPDTLTVALGVQTQASEAQAALQDNSRKATALIDTLKSNGVADEDVRTSQLSVNPTWEPGGARITGYQVTNQVTATLHDISQAGTLIDAAAATAGDAIRVQQVTFSIADDSDLRAEARSRAVRQAQDQAQQMADTAGVKLGKVRSIVEVPAQAPRSSDPSMRAPDAVLTDTVPIEAGSQELTVNVAVTYDIG